MTGAARGEEPAGSPRQRLFLAGGMLIALLALVGLILVLSGGDEERSFATAPARCVESWNKDPLAVSLGRHQSSYHHYVEVEVLTLTEDGAAETAETDPGATCGVAFASSSLDAELAAAALVERPSGWTPLTDSAGAERLAELQSEAKSHYNATLTPEGQIVPLS